MPDGELEDRVVKVLSEESSLQPCVTLVGTVKTDEQRRAAEEDGWSLFGVDLVVSQLRLRPPA